MSQVEAETVLRELKRANAALARATARLPYRRGPAQLAALQEAQPDRCPWCDGPLAPSKHPGSRPHGTCGGERCRAARQQAYDADRRWRDRKRRQFHG